MNQSNKRIRKSKKDRKIARTGKEADKKELSVGHSKNDNEGTSDDTEMLNASDDVDSENLLRRTAADSILNSRKGIVSNVSFASKENKVASSRHGSYTKPEKKALGKNNLLNIKQLLKKAEENKSLIDELKRSADPANHEKAEQAEWDKLERKALGERVPEPKHIRKKVIGLEKKKEKAAQQWAARTKLAGEEKQGRLDKREANLKKRQGDRVTSKLKRKGIVLPKDSKDEKENQKVGRKRAGLEGRRSSYLNEKKTKQ
jgi:hypothetical protein